MNDGLALWKPTEINKVPAGELDRAQLIQLASVTLPEDAVLFGATRLSDLSTVLVEAGNQVGLSGGRVVRIEQDYDYENGRYIWTLVGYWEKP